MTQNYSVSLEKIIAAHNLEIIYLPKPADEILITTNEVNRPGIVMTGYTDYFDADRIQILGWTEFGFLLNMEPEKRRRALQYWLALHPAAAVVTRGWTFRITSLRSARRTRCRCCAPKRRPRPS